MSNKLYRILDANYNRSKEATRVCEDILRFLLDHAQLSKKMKSLRHEITRALLSYPVSYHDLVLARDSKHDVIKNFHLSDQIRRPNAKELLIINLKRAQESLRVLEEISHIISREHAHKFRKLRFKVYELEKKALQQI